MVIFLGIGTNLGDREANLRTALHFLHERVGECLACSSIYRSAPQGFVSENEFANMVVACKTDYSPEDILRITQQIEREMGRTEKSVNGVYHDRVIDIDLLKALTPSNSPFKGENYVEGEEVVCCTETLTLPHPRMHERDFVMIPLREVETILKPLVSNL
jgi:2-amino-4-hydroxy-6-hydroxymethyldihydropteridine diphosphokinase